MTDSTFFVSITLKRDDDMREHDESWFDVENMSTELRVWLENLDFVVSDITINEAAKTDSIRILSFHADPGHGWLVVPIDEVREAKLSISGYSYINRDLGMAYLEEDCDAMVFINHLKKNNVPFTISETHINDNHPIRGYESWPEEWNPKSDVQQWFDDHVEVVQIG